MPQGIDLLTVAVLAPVRRPFDYLPQPEGQHYEPGQRVWVPFGRQRLLGMVVARSTAAVAANALPETTVYKAISETLDPVSLVPRHWLDSLRWAAGYYQFPLGEVIAAALPAPLREGRHVALRRLHRLGLSEAGQAALPGLSPRAHRLRTLLETLRDAPILCAVGESLPGIEASVLRRARQQGWLSEQLVSAPEPPIQAGLQLTAPQARALSELRAAGPGFSVSLLEGVTGSGKTELYLCRTADTLAAGRQVLVLCPEIGLTPQLLRQFRDRFGTVVVAYHSGMSDAERTQSWLAVREGQARVLVGTRSAVFAPFAALGLVVVDEEHDASYKQQEGFRYHARDLALVRAKSAGAAVILGSATPALESLANAQAGRYRPVQLQERVTALPPAVPVTIDLNVYPARHGLSEPLVAAVQRHLEAGGQALLFINRRGYAPTLLCETCHWVAPCPRCDARLNVHRGPGVLRCHHCGYETTPPHSCPSCGQTRLLPVGEGVERVEDALRNRFPGRRVERFDTDRLRAAGRLESLMDDVRARRIDILVGTQLLAKGHDFPHLSLVGVVNADQALFSSDFRALERLGQQLTQVAGRAGRTADSPLPPEVLIQSREPQHPALVKLLTEGYAALATQLLDERRQAGLPPYGVLALLRAEHADRRQVQAFLEAARAGCPTDWRVDVLGPASAPMERREGRYRMQLLLRAGSRTALHRHLPAWVEAIEALPRARQVRWSLDVDPVDLF